MRQGEPAEVAKVIDQRADTVEAPKRDDVQRQADVQGQADAQREADERKQADERRQAESQKRADAQKQAEERKQAEAQKRADAQKVADAQKISDARKSADSQRLADAQKLAEGPRLVDVERRDQDAAEKAWLSGTIAGAKGASFAGWTVQVRDVGSDKTTSVVADASGSYRLPVESGHRYEIDAVVDAQGQRLDFVHRGRVTARAGEAVPLSVKLK
jgi:hypothetical protein